MPEITFILPHWIYWGGIFAAPAALMFFARRRGGGAVTGRAALPLAYFFLLVGGFMGIHRLYLKHIWAAVFILLFVGVIYCNNEARLTRNAHSLARNDVSITQYDIKRAQDYDEPQEVIDALTAALPAQQEKAAALAQQLENWHATSRALALVILLLLLTDAALLPKLVARRRQQQANEPAAAPPLPPHEDATAAAEVGADAFSRAISAFNRHLGEYVSYWTVVAVFVFYYEVVARYIFNSPTIWAHESMYLLFGMQYLLAGGFCLREGAHVRVDVLYMHLSPRARAVADLTTATFFFLFAVALAVTGWIFFYDSFQIKEVSFTEWAIPHWPIKFALPLGGLLIALQGTARLLHSIAVLRELKQG